MADVFSKDKRSEIMKGVRSSGNKSTELKLIQYFSSNHITGWRRKYNVKGHPDFVFLDKRIAIFVDGCFWHGHDNCKYFRLPKTNIDFWQKKIERNKERDKKEQCQLAAMGWHCITIWECRLKPKVRIQTLESLAYTLNHIFLEDRKVKTYQIAENDNSFMAAEPEVSYGKIDK